jgi:hypothetical protein
MGEKEEDEEEKKKKRIEGQVLIVVRVVCRKLFASASD